MHTPDCSDKTWCARFRRVMKVRMVGNWTLLVVVLILAFGIVPATQDVHALDRVASPLLQGTQVNLVLQVDTSDPKLNRLCVGERVLLPVRVMLQSIAYTGDGDVAGFTVRNADIDAVAANNVVSAVQSSATSDDPTPGAPFRAFVELTGEETGRTTVSISATIQSSVNYSLDPEIALPIPVTSQAGPISVPVRVVPCEYRVNIGSIWTTSMHGAFTLLIANVHNARLRGGQSDTFEFEPPETGIPFLEWTWANNRIIGCWASSGHFNTRAPTIRATRSENHIDLTIEYSRAVPGDSNSPYYRNLCLPHFTVGTALCSDRPDGYCWTMPPAGDWFQPRQPDPEGLRFSLDGGTATTTQLINHSWGSANGTVHITLTPVRLQP